MVLRLNAWMDVVVVGGGIVGAAAAWRLAAAGARVVVVDRGDPGQATAAGAGIVGPWLAAEDDPVWRAAAYAAAAGYADVVAELAETGEPEVGYARVGALLVDADEAALTTLEARTRRRAAAQPVIGAVTALPAPEAHRAFPPLRDDLGAVHVAGAARVDGRLMRDALLRSARRHGARVRHGVAGLALAPGGRIRVVVDGTVLGADAVVVAAGAWTAELVRPLGPVVPVAPSRGQIVHLDLPDHAADTAGWPLVQPSAGPYLLGFPAGRIVAGATREPGAGFAHRVTAGGVAQVLASALAVAPALASATVVETRVGFRPQADDDLPILGGWSELPGLVVATGLGATGLTMGPWLGGHAARLVLGAAAPDGEPDLSPYRPDRLVEAVRR